MEHFRAYCLFSVDYFFNVSDTLFMQIPIEKLTFYKFRRRYIQYMKTTDSEK